MEFCLNCKKNVDVIIKQQTCNCDLFGVEFTYVEKEGYCKECNKPVFVDSIENENLRACYSAYRKCQGLISMEDTLKISNMYGISKEEISLLLGWDRELFGKYCEGYIPSHEHSDQLLKLLDPKYFNKLLSESNKKI